MYYLRVREASVQNGSHWAKTQGTGRTASLSLASVGLPPPWLWLPFVFRVKPSVAALVRVRSHPLTTGGIYKTSQPIEVLAPYSPPQSHSSQRERTYDTDKMQATIKERERERLKHTYTHKNNGIKIKRNTLLWAESLEGIN